jgi:histidyl-tRNA synthetase
MKIKAVAGTKDILPAETKIWSLLETRAKSICEVYGYRQIRTPLMEEARLFTRSIGKGSDIVRKEMYSFFDRKKRLLCLRPEATASVVRAYLEHNLEKSLELAKFYYSGPMFRGERPQAGRLRQFHHIGAEAIGSMSPYLDAEVISLAMEIIREIGVAGCTLQLNSIGCRQDRQKYKLVLKAALKNKLKSLCADCNSRYKLNLLRIFDCKNETCKKIVRETPSIIDSLCVQCAGHFDNVRQILDSLKITCELNPYLVRGLDYYTKTCFEINHPRLGAQNAVGAGGRYDNLVSDLGGPEKPAIGFALGVERLIAALKKPASGAVAEKPFPCIYIAVIGEEAKPPAFEILKKLRRAGILSEMDYLDKSLKGQMRQADKLGADYTVIIGEEELKKDAVILRDMKSKGQREIRTAKLVKELQRLK